MRAIIFALLLAIAPATYAQRANVSGIQEVVIARVLLVQPVQIEPRQTNTGSNLGRQVGYEVGRQASSNDYFIGQIASSIGQSIGQGVQNKRFVRGVEFILQDHYGKTRSIIQEGNTNIRAGDTVAVVGHGQNTRVIPMGAK